MLLEIVNTVNSYLSDYILVFLPDRRGPCGTPSAPGSSQIRYFGEGMRRPVRQPCPSGADGRSGA